MENHNDHDKGQCDSKDSHTIPKEPRLEKASKEEEDLQ